MIYLANYFKLKNIKWMGYFYNPNIHPYREFRNRIRALETVAEVKNFEVVWEKEYGLRMFLKEVLFLENKPRRCERCYYLRLKKTVEKAVELKAEAFTTTLLYSIYQDHELIKEICEDFANRYKIDFFYEDFRKGYKEGQEEAKKLDIYRQGYCGCIFSEEERYYKKRRKELLRAGIRV